MMNRISGITINAGNRAAFVLQPQHAFLPRFGGEDAQRLRQRGAEAEGLGECPARRFSAHQSPLSEAGQRLPAVGHYLQLVRQQRESAPRPGWSRPFRGLPAPPPIEAEARLRADDEHVHRVRQAAPQLLDGALRRKPSTQLGPISPTTPQMPATTVSCPRR